MKLMCVVPRPCRPRKHISQSLQFTIQRQPMLGCELLLPPIELSGRTQPCLPDGSVTCLREGCNKASVPLDSSKDADAKDGGITRGFGSFTAYQVASCILNNERPCLLTLDKVAYSDRPPQSAKGRGTGISYPHRLRLPSHARCCHLSLR